ncbi:MAG TPA: YihA family ribosome biogenesis GTP-binding protein [Gammaproteobacteria bacterium]|nr:YihA family ribosome biogenesis GTP-binding protein [Gammaproteobacteria bacterium]
MESRPSSLNLYRSARFELSAATPKQFPRETGPEVAFAGRSNAGKSSTLNRLCQQKQLARVSKTPGRTQLVNFFQLSNGARLVDLPGYGFAKAPEGEIARWGRLIEAYLSQRNSLRGLIIIMDARRPMREKDRQMLEWSQYHGIPAHIVLNKADKLKRGELARARQKTDALLRKDFDSVSLQTFSALKGEGIDALHTRLDEWLVE